LLNSSVTIKDILKDTSVVKTDNTNLIMLIYHANLAGISLDTLLTLPDTSNTASIKLNSITINPISSNYRISLGNLANEDTNIMTYINLTKKIPFPFPAYGPIKTSNIAINLGQYFTRMSIMNGTVSISINDSFPVNFTNIIFTLRNATPDSALVFSDTIPLVKAFTTLNSIKQMSHVSINSNLVANYIFSESGNPTPMKADSSWHIVSTFSISNINIDSAVAIFPAQNVISYANENAYNLQGFQFTKVLFKSGQIIVNVYNTLPSALSLYYVIPNATSSTNSTDTLKIIQTIPAASHITQTQNMAGWVMDLRGIGPIDRKLHINPGKADTVNTFYSIVTAGIAQTNTLISLSLHDSIYIKGQFVNMLPEYAEGFLGNDSLSLNSSFNYTNILKNLKFDQFSLQSVNLFLDIYNSIGANASIRINKITAINSTSNISVNLTGSLIGSLIPVNKPNKPATDSVTPAFTEIAINSVNSNPEKLIDIIPDKFNCSVQAFINPGKKTPVPDAGTDFIYYGSTISVKLGIEIPLSLIAKNLRLSDTAVFSLGSTNLTAITGGSLKVNIGNNFPLEAFVQIYLTDANNNLIDSLFVTPGQVLAATSNPVTNRTTASKQTILSVPMTGNRLANLTKTKKIIIYARFYTVSANATNQFVKIYDDYTIVVKLIGDFIYKVD